MPLLNFGQPDKGIMQMAYVVPDLRASIAQWIQRLNVGPWFVLEHFSGEHPVYRGKPSRADVAIAMSFAGHMNIELIQSNDDHPSVYKEHIDRHGYGFHHWGIATADFAGDLKRYETMGMQVAFRLGVPTGEKSPISTRTAHCPDSSSLLRPVPRWSGRSADFTAPRSTGMAQTPSVRSCSVAAPEA